MEVPAFSIFSAISEVFVTIVVVSSIFINMRGGKLHWKPLGAVLVFELCVNIVYMASRASKTDSSSELSSAMKLFLAGHGILSLLMFIGLAILFILAIIDLKQNKPTWFQRNQAGSWFFLALWMVSVISGEVIFFMFYGAQLFS